MKICSIADCTNKVIARGLCDNHYRRLLRNGSPHFHINGPWGKSRTVRTDGYIYVTRDGKQVMEHRWLMEQKLGRKLTQDEVVHHIDGNKQNNVLDNLALMTKSSHKAYHQTEVVRYRGKALAGIRGPSNDLEKYRIDKSATIKSGD